MIIESNPGVPAGRAVHPTVARLVGDVDLAVRTLEARADAKELSDFIKMLANAEYWLSFDLASFEDLLTCCPSPLRELGVALLLRYSESVGGTLDADDLQRARDDLQVRLPEDLAKGVLEAVDSLTRAVEARDARDQFLSQGFRAYRQSPGMNVHALRAMGAATIHISGVDTTTRQAVLPLGVPVELRADDERGRPLEPPDVESRLRAEALVKSRSGLRTVVFLVPGEYTFRVPTKATGHRKVLVR